MAGMPFWRKLEPDCPAASYQLPPFTDDVLAQCEKKFGVKLPRRLVDLLRTQNGGLVENGDFRFQGEDYGVSQMLGILDGKSYRAIRPFSDILDDQSPEEMRDAFRAQAGDSSRVLFFADNDYELYGLDYSRLNASGEPTILRVVMADCEVRCKQVASSFAEFLECQYFGDCDPVVVMEEANNYELLAEGGYAGHHCEGESPVKMDWKICGDGDRFIVFTREYWSHNPPEYLTRSEFKKSDLLSYHRVAKWEVQESGSEFVAMIRRGVERFKVLVKPDCYVLRLEVGPGTGNSMATKETVSYGDLWKNSYSDRFFVTVYSADRTALENVFTAMVQCT